MEGKRASERLKAINHQMEEAASQGIATDGLNEWVFKNMAVATCESYKSKLHFVLHA